MFTLGPQCRRFPLIFQALAEGRIHLTGVSLLAPRLTEENAEELLAAAFHKTKREIQLLIAARFPQPDLPTFVASLGAAPAAPATAHEVPPGNLEAVLKFALRAAKQKLEQRRFAATERPRAGHRRSNPDALSRPRCGGRCGSGMAASARSPVTRAGAVRNAEI